MRGMKSKRHLPTGTGHGFHRLGSRVVRPDWHGSKAYMNIMNRVQREVEVEKYT